MTRLPKISICTTPIRPIPTDYPPLGSLSIITALKRAGFKDTEFYNIDLVRPSFDEVVEHYRKTKPDIVGISAVVSTAYEYSKRLSLKLKEILPDVTIILGGNMGASAEVILRKTGVDFVCTGEGEHTTVDFAKAWKPGAGVDDFKGVEGISYLKDGVFTMTPYPAPITPEEVYDVDWSIMEELDQLRYFLIPAEKSPMLKLMLEWRPDVMKKLVDGDKRVVTLNASKGCVARCTFCHRFDKGLRNIPVPKLMKEIDFWIDKYNAGFLNFGDENFGSNRRWLEEFCREVKKRNLYWRVGGMRVSQIKPEWIAMMKDAGCVAIVYGMESGSQSILDVMEKKTTVEQNKRALKWMSEAELMTVVQLIIGMPGESPRTISETADFLAYSAGINEKLDPNQVSINFAQALPGTPLYEIARRDGQIGRDIDEEEKYLLLISDRDARDAETTLNFTDYPKLVVEGWDFRIQITSRISYIKKWGWDRYKRFLLKTDMMEHTPRSSESPEKDSGYFADPARAKEKGMGASHKDFVPASSHASDTIHDVKETYDIQGRYPSLFRIIRERKFGFAPIFYPNLFWNLRAFSYVFVTANMLRRYGVGRTIQYFGEFLVWLAKRPFKARRDFAYQSLRRAMRDYTGASKMGGAVEMQPLREGR